MSTTSIYIRTCLHDQEYHKYCLASIERFCTGFLETVVTDGEHPRGYLKQQCDKLNSDLCCKGDFILVTDSDTLFTEPVTPESFMRDGKPIWLYTPGTPEMLAHAGTAKWKQVMEDFFGWESKSEKMRRQPFMFPREVLQGLRDFCRSRHAQTIEEYVMSKGVFTEWNVLAEYCWTYHHDLFYWVNTAEEELPPLRTRQFWSHSPLAENIAEIQQILA